MALRQLRRGGWARALDRGSHRVLYFFNVPPGRDALGLRQRVPLFGGFSALDVIGGVRSVWRLILEPHRAPSATGASER